MRTKTKLIALATALLMLMHTACTLPYTGRTKENKSMPTSYNTTTDTLNSAGISWKIFFNDPKLTALIDTALQNNQELNMITQEIQISRNEVRARKGQYLPFMGLGGRAGIEKVGRYTSQGASDATHEIMPGKKFPEPLPHYVSGINASWDLDIWSKLRNSKKAAVFKYLATTEGRNFMVTGLVAEIANSYYELMALDNQLDFLNRNIEIQQNALQIVKLEKEAAKVTELAVRRFEAEVLKNQSRKFYMLQQITEMENRINFLIGRFPQPVARNSSGFTSFITDTIHAGIPSQLLENRADIRQAEQELVASRLDVKVAKAEFFPSLRITGGMGYGAFNPRYLMQSPESMIYSVAADAVMPLINRNAIKANYYSANSRQIQAVYHYEQVILRAHIEVANQLANVGNLEKSYDLKAKQVQALTRSIDISTSLFKSARADYMEVLLTQRDALESKFEMIETKKQQMNARVYLYKALGGGWK